MEKQNMNAKKTFAIAVSLILSLGLIGCASQQPTTNTSSTSIDTSSTTTTTTTPTTTNSTTTVEVITLNSETIAYNGERGGSRGNDRLSATITVDTDGIVRSLSVNTQSGEPKSQMYQNSFKQAITSYVVGKPLKTITIGKVSGASYTSEAFQQALDSLKTQYTG